MVVDAGKRVMNKFSCHSRRKRLPVMFANECAYAVAINSSCIGFLSLTRWLQPGVCSKQKNEKGRIATKKHKTHKRKKEFFVSDFVL